MIALSVKITCMYCHNVYNIKMTNSSSPSPLAEMAMRWICHLINSPLFFQTAFNWLLNFQSVDTNTYFSYVLKEDTLLFEKLVLVHVLLCGYSLLGSCVAAPIMCMDFMFCTSFVKMCFVSCLVC